MSPPPKGNTKILGLKLRTRPVRQLHKLMTIKMLLDAMTDDCSIELYVVGTIMTVDLQSTMIPRPETRDGCELGGQPPTGGATEVTPHGKTDDVDLLTQVTVCSHGACAPMRTVSWFSSDEPVGFIRCSPCAPCCSCSDSLSQWSIIPPGVCNNVFSYRQLLWNA